LDADPPTQGVKIARRMTAKSSMRVSGQLPKKLAAGPRVLARTESSGSQSGTKQGGPPHDHWAKLGNFGALQAGIRF
jgi:hypothetical protein